MEPEVSVVMAVHNGQPYLADSVRSILEQSYRDFEFIIVDDGSTDDTGRILGEFASVDSRVVVLRNDANQGMSLSLNRGLSLARGRFIARQDADDHSLPERLDYQVAYLRERGQVGLLGTAYHVIDATGQPIATYRQPSSDTGIRWQMLFHNAFCHSSVMFRKGLIDAGDLFYDESLPYSQDYDLWVRMIKRTGGANLSTPHVAWRSNEESISATRRGEQQSVATAISSGQIKQLLAKSPISFDEVTQLRSWYYAFPTHLEKGDLPLCHKLVRILGAFSREPEVDSKDFRRVVKDWTDRIMGSIFPRQLHDPGMRRLLRALFNLDPMSLASYLPRKALRHWRPVSHSGVSVRADAR